FAFSGHGAAAERDGYRAHSHDPQSLIYPRHGTGYLLLPVEEKESPEDRRVFQSGGPAPQLASSGGGKSQEDAGAHAQKLDSHEFGGGTDGTAASAAQDRKSGV